MSCPAAPLGGAEDVLRGDRDGQQVPVVDRAAVQLLGEHAEQIHPGELAGERGRLLGRHCDYSLDDFNCGSPEAAARFCSQARFRQVFEHHFGTGPLARGVIGPLHQPQAVAAARRVLPLAGVVTGSWTRARPWGATPHCCG